MNDSEDIRRIFRPLIQRWYLIVLGALLGTAKGWTSFHEAIPSYQCRATIQINDKHSSLAKYMEDFEDFSMTGKYEVELSMMRSKHVAWEGLKTLDLEVFYFKHERGHFRNLYGQAIFSLEIEGDNPDLMDQLIEFDLKRDGRLNLKLPGEEGQMIESKLGDVLTMDGLSLRILPDSTNSQTFYPGRYAFQLNSKQGLLESLANMEVLWIRLQNEKTPIINLYTWNEVPTLAADVANAVAHAYIRFYLNNKLELAGWSLTAVDQQLDSLQARMIQVERQIAEFQGRHLAWNSEQAIKEQQSMMKDLNRIRLNHQFHLNALENLNEGLVEDSIQKLLPRTYESLRDQGFVNGLREWEKWSLKRQEFSSRLTDLHPGMVSLDSLLKGLLRDIQERIAITQQQQEQKVGRIDLSIQGAEKRILELIQLEKELLALQREAADLDLAYMELIDKRTEAVISAAANIHFHRMLEHAMPPIEPIKPVFHVVVGLNGLMGALYAILLIVLYRLLLSRMSHPSDLSIVSRMPRLPSLTHLPPSIEKTNQELLRLASDLHFRQGIRWVNVLSYSSKEGSAQIATHLAGAFAAIGMKTLLIDADVFRQGITMAHGISDRDGITQVLMENQPPLSVIIPSEIEGLDVLGWGWNDASSPAQLLHHVDLPPLMQRFKQEYDYVVIHLPAMSHSQDAWSLLPFGDITLYTVKNHLSKFGQIKKMEQILEDVSAPQPHLLFWWVKRQINLSSIWRSISA